MAKLRRSKIKAAAPAAAPTANAPRIASIFCSEELPAAFTDAVRGLEQSLNMPVWCLIQQGSGQFGSLDDRIRDAFLQKKADFRSGQKVALLLQSPGGIAASAYRVASFLTVRCGGFVALVPGAAKSAATLLALGAESIILSPYGELGPLDAQAYDAERESRHSVLEDVQSLERLDAFALRSVDQTMQLILQRSNMKVATLLPIAMTFTADLMRPLMENIDVLRYAEMSRALKVAEEYAVRLLEKQFSPREATDIAAKLVSNYPEHGFPIDLKEARELGLHAIEATPEQDNLFDRMSAVVNQMTVLGRVT